jgi:hypothetical protein
MTQTGEAILRSLEAVAAERAARALDPALGDRVVAVKAFQRARFSLTYSDLMQDPRYAAATQFFLDDLYGPADFAQRDAQFARIVPALVRLFPDEIVQTVADLGVLHALSERLDTAMARRMAEPRLDGASYGAAWRDVGDASSRERQIQLMVSVGTALDGFTRKLLLRNSLRLMRAPAAAAGLGALQQFLETGFETFRAMRGAQVFLDTIATRERSLAAQLFAGEDLPSAPRTEGPLLGA